jgi:hypothetical protein
VLQLLKKKKAGHAIGTRSGQSLKLSVIKKPALVTAPQVIKGLNVGTRISPLKLHGKRVKNAIVARIIVPAMKIIEKP